MTCFQLGLVFTVAMPLITLAVCHEDMTDSMDKSRKLVSVSRLSDIAEHVNSLDVNWKAGLPKSWVEIEDALLDLSHLIGTMNSKSRKKIEFKKRNTREISEYLFDNDSGSGNGHDDDDDDDDDDEDAEETANHCEDSNMPADFDAREKWPGCPSIGHIYDQGNCKSDWALSAVAAFADRLCIASNGKYTQMRSANQILACTGPRKARYGCRGGSHIAALIFLQKHGLVTGGDYNSQTGCQPYSFPPCHHIGNDTKELASCSSYPLENVPKCDHTCSNEKHTISYKKDRITARECYSVKPCDIQKEIYENGPVIATMKLYEDFLVYQQGVYWHITGIHLTQHVVRIIGWGEEKETRYWLVANSWNDLWGDGGFVKIVRDHNIIQEPVMACTPHL